MCGIAGVVCTRTSGGYRTLDPTSAAIGKLRHRGPDGRGGILSDLGWAGVATGGTRLAIVDLHALAVPAWHPELGVVLAYNGEVYNWRELRCQLSDGRPWKTECDTEVVARAWRAWGPQMLHRLNGMFAFALVDLHAQRVFLARDRAGEKPLYFTVEGDDRFCFASEIKALPTEAPLQVDPAGCPELDVFEFDCLASTPFRGVRALGPGQYLDLRGPADIARPVPETWWALDPQPDEAMTWQSAVDQTEAIFVDAVKIRTQTAPSSTAFVSGGLDSALVQAVAQFPQVFCCTFPADGMDWLPGARLAAPGAEVVPVTFDLHDAEAVGLPQAAYYLDTPATWSALAHWFLAAAVKQHGHKIVLSGEGADELFAGYSRYRVLWWIAQARYDPQLENYQAVADLLMAQCDPHALATLLDRSSSGSARAHALALIDQLAVGTHPVTRLCTVEWYTTMQCLLRMADRMTAAHSLENRSPFLDYRLIELAMQMPMRHKITPVHSKAVLREVARRLGVHPSIIEDQHKRGLVVPWNQWRQGLAGVRALRGAWDRADFAHEMRNAWCATFAKSEEEATACARS